MPIRDLLTHRRCRTNQAAAENLVEHLAQVARRQSDRAEDLEQALREEQLAAGHLVDEIRAACQDEEQLADAAIPEPLVERLLQAYDRQRVLRDHVEVLEQLSSLQDQLAREQERQRRMLAAAHAAGTLARTYAPLTRDDDMGPAAQETARLLAGVRLRAWHQDLGWPCQNRTCGEAVRTLAWHGQVPERAHLACVCGRVWPAPLGTVERGEVETRLHQRWGTCYEEPLRWAHLGGPVLEAVDRALPRPSELHGLSASALTA